MLTRIINSFHPKINCKEISKREQLTQWTSKISMHLVTTSQEMNFQHFSWKKKKVIWETEQLVKRKIVLSGWRNWRQRSVFFFPFISLGNRENKKASKKKEGAQLYSVQGWWGSTQTALKQISTHFLSQVKSELGGIHSIDYSC